MLAAPAVVGGGLLGVGGQVGLGSLVSMEVMVDVGELGMLGEATCLLRTMSWITLWEEATTWLRSLAWWAAILTASLWWTTTTLLNSTLLPRNLPSQEISHTPMTPIRQASSTFTIPTAIITGIGRVPIWPFGVRAVYF
ncbi:hypothetical protein B0T17DRAFT_525155 [Bombardia bombarda]|uniref:Uncharacterized protein n=1 Tax=Bombardia bombarda TaxID=252184 RepID=A0AA39X9L9_9PEZI|nr:hypothetical protein B0T17DRAFT_525155 [Bombardia bombarda]